MDSNWPSLTVSESTTNIERDVSRHIWKIRNFKDYLSTLDLATEGMELSTTFEAGSSSTGVMASTWKATLKQRVANYTPLPKHSYPKSEYWLYLQLEPVSFVNESSLQKIKGCLPGKICVQWNALKGLENSSAQETKFKIDPSVSNSPKVSVSIELFKKPVKFAMQDFAAAKLDLEDLVIPLELQLWSSSVSPTATQLMDAEMRELTTGIASLWPITNPGKFTDVEIHVKDGNDSSVFHTHRMILIVRSPVFAAMFDNSMKEASTGVIEITDIPKEIMQKLLEYMYTGSLKVEEEDADVIAGLAYSAEKYQLQGLLKLIDKRLMEACTPKNCLVLLEVARKYNLEEAKVGIKQVVAEL